MASRKTITYTVSLSNPTELAYTNGKVTNVYSITSKNYNIKKVVKYLNRIGVIVDD